MCFIGNLCIVDFILFFNSSSYVMYDRPPNIFQVVSTAQKHEVGLCRAGQPILLHFLIHIDVLMLCRKFELISIIKI